MGPISYKQKQRTARMVIGAILIVYSLITIVPFYFLMIRSFVPTIESTELHLWIPKPKGVNLKVTWGNLTTYYNLDAAALKGHFGVTGYVQPNTSMEEFLDEYDIDRSDLLRYLNPYVKYNGWLTILTDDRFVRSFVNTTLLTVSSCVVGGFLGICTASVIAKFRRPWHQVVFNIYMLSMIIPFVMIMIPLYIIVGRHLHLQNSYLALFLNFIKGGALNVLIFTSYISTIPDDLKLSVYVDGGSRFRYFYSILLPLSKVPFATFVVIRFPFFWNNLILGKLFLNEENYTLIPLIDSFRGTYTTNYQAIYSGLALSILPVLILYLTFQKLFIRSALSGAVKG